MTRPLTTAELDVLEQTHSAPVRALVAEVRHTRARDAALEHHARQAAAYMARSLVDSFVYRILAGLSDGRRARHAVPAGPAASCATSQSASSAEEPFARPRRVGHSPGGPPVAGPEASSRALAGDGE